MWIEDFFDVARAWLQPSVGSRAGSRAPREAARHAMVAATLIGATAFAAPRDLREPLTFGLVEGQPTPGPAFGPELRAPSTPEVRRARLGLDESYKQLAAALELADGLFEGGASALLAAAGAGLESRGNVDELPEELFPGLA